MSEEQLDLEMLTHLDLLLDYDAVENESEWDVVEKIDEAEQSDDEAATAKGASQGGAQ